MPANATPVYVNQVLEKRYVKVKVLEEFLDNNVKEFGRDRSIEIGRDNRITLVVLRELTQDEIVSIQKKSFPNQFEDPFALN